MQGVIFSFSGSFLWNFRNCFEYGAILSHGCLLAVIRQFAVRKRSPIVHYGTTPTPPPPFKNCIQTYGPVWRAKSQFSTQATCTPTKSLGTIEDINETIKIPSWCTTSKQRRFNVESTSLVVVAAVVVLM